MDIKDLFSGMESFLEKDFTTQETEKTEEKEQKEEEIGFTLDELEEKLKQDREAQAEPGKENETPSLEEIKAKGEKVEKKEEGSQEGNEEAETSEASEENEEANPKTEVFVAVSEMFMAEGLIGEKFDSPEKMIEVFGNRIKEEVEDYKNELPEVIKELINNYEEGVPLEDLIKIKSETIKYSNISEDKLEEDEDLRKKVVTDHLKKTTRFSEEKIKKEVKRLEDLGELLDESKTAVKELVDLEKEQEAKLKAEIKSRQEEERKENEKYIKEIKQTVSKVSEIIPGIKMSDKEKEEVFKMMTTAAEIRGKQALSKAMVVREANPVQFDMTLNYLIKQGVFEGKWDTIIKKAETKQLSKLEKQVEDAAAKLQAKTGNTSIKVESGNKLEDNVKKVKDAMKNLKFN